MKEITGVTRHYPQGKLNDTDEGELTLAIGYKGDTICIDFGKPVEWIGMSREEAIGLAHLLLEYANNG